MTGSAGFFFMPEKKNVFLLNSLADLSLESVRCLLKHPDTFCVDHSSHSARHRNSFFRLQRLRTARPLRTNSSLLSLFVLAQFSLFILAPVCTYTGSFYHGYPPAVFMLNATMFDTSVPVQVTLATHTWRIHKRKDRREVSMSQELKMEVFFGVHTVAVKHH